MRKQNWVAELSSQRKVNAQADSHLVWVHGVDTWCWVQWKHYIKRTGLAARPANNPMASMLLFFIAHVAKYSTQDI
jgi:hypothetical protein